jgi:hypothetical protein
MITPAESTRVVEFWSALEVHAMAVKRQTTVRIAGHEAKWKKLLLGLLFDCMVCLTIWVAFRRCPNNLEQA